MTTYHELSDKTVTTRKPHECGWCGERIEKGDLAQARYYIWENGPASDWMHPECYTAMCTYPDQQDLWDGWIPGEFIRGRWEADRDKL